MPSPRIKVDAHKFATFLLNLPVGTMIDLPIKFSIYDPEDGYVASTHIDATSLEWFEKLFKQRAEQQGVSDT